MHAIHSFLHVHGYTGLIHVQLVNVLSRESQWFSSSCFFSRRILVDERKHEVASARGRWRRYLYSLWWSAVVWPHRAVEGTDTRACDGDLTRCWHWAHLFSGREVSTFTVNIPVAFFCSTSATHLQRLDLHFFLIFWLICTSWHTFYSYSGHTSTTMSGDRRWVWITVLHSCLTYHISK